MIVLAGENDAVSDFAQHGFVEQVVVWAIQGQAGDALANAEFNELEAFGLAAYCSGRELLGGADRLN
jgi:hypothetical protein